MSNEKLDEILLLLKDENIGLCGRMRQIERTVNGNGKPGLAEAVRVNSRNWGIFTTCLTISITLVFKYWVK